MGNKRYYSKSHYNNLGNYDYFVDYLKNDMAILVIDQRNHGESGKNIDIAKMKNILSNFDLSLSLEAIDMIIECLLKNDKATLNNIVASLSLSEDKKIELLNILKRPIIKDMSFLRMKDDLDTVINQMKNSEGYEKINLVGTCMGGLVSCLYAVEKPENVNSLTLFSPLLTLDEVFINPQNDFGKKKQEILHSGKQFRMGNCVEGIETEKEVASFMNEFLKKFYTSNIPMFCIQGTDDALVPCEAQNNIFANVKRYRDVNEIDTPIYYAQLGGVHCLYDNIFACLDEAGQFLISCNDTEVRKI